MKATTRNMAEAITQALGPIFRANPDYKTITEAIALTVARVAQSTQDRGFEVLALDSITKMADEALTQFLNEEEALLEAKAKVLAKGIDGFAEMFGPANGLAAINGGVSPEACAEAEEFAGQDHVLKAMREEDQALNDLTGLPEGIEIPVELYGNPESRLDPNGVFITPSEASWENSPLHEEIARFEQEHPELRNGDDGCNPDGPRAYL